MAINPAHKSLCAWRVGPLEERPEEDALDSLIVVIDSLAMFKSNRAGPGKSSEK
jgi:hypothetical protein